MRCVCSRTQQLPCSYTSQFNYYKPNVIIGESDRSDSAPSDAIVCNGRGRGGVVAQAVKAGETLGMLPLCAVPKHTPPKRLATQLSCHNAPRSELEVTVAAPHPGDCALYVSYDGDAVSDANKK